MPLHWTWQCTAHRQSEVEGCWTDTQHGEVHIQSEFAQISWSRDLKRWNLAWYSPYWSDYRPPTPHDLPFLCVLSSYYFPVAVNSSRTLRRRRNRYVLWWGRQLRHCLNGLQKQTNALIHRKHHWRRAPISLSITPLSRPSCQLTHLTMSSGGCWRNYM